MTFPVVGSNIPSSYEISNSLRFNDGDSPYLSKSFSTVTNTKKFTVSFWFKPSAIPQSNYSGFLDVGGDNAFALFSDSTIYFFEQGGAQFYWRPQRLFRDCSAWYHIVLACDSTLATQTDRVKIYVNGVRETSFHNNSGPSQNYDFGLNTTSNTRYIGTKVSTSSYYDGYLAEYYQIDGQQLQASDFGEFDEDSGIWKPKIYEGTFGDAGYYLKFNNTGNMGEDSSGNDNTFTPTNLSGTTDVTTDTPTNNFATLNPLSAFENDGTTYFNGNYTMAEGNTRAVSSGNAGAWGHSFSTIGMSSGKWYWEVRTNSISNSTHVGVSQLFVSGYFQNQTTSRNINLINGSSTGGAGAGAYNLSAFSAGDILMIALDMDNGEVYFGKNGTWGGSGNPATNTNPCFTGLDTTTEYFAGFDLAYTGSFSWNYGSPDFSISSGNSDGNGYGNFEYAPPSGYLALCTQNLATALSPTIDDGSQYFNTVLYTGTGSSTSITGVGFQPDLVYTTSRSNGYNNGMFDSVRGVQKEITTNTNNAEATLTTAISSFDSDGFSFSGSAYNTSAYTFVAWNWKANAGSTSSNTDGSITSTVQANTTAGFSIVTYTGTGSASTVGHGLGVAPKMLIVKERDNANDWKVYHHSIGNDKTVRLDATDPQTSDPTTFNSTTPTSSVFSVNSNATNRNGGGIIAYCFAEIEGYSKFGSYVGNNSSTDGTFVYLGFRPSFVLAKNISRLETWWIRDSARDTYNPTTKTLKPQNSVSEQTAGEIDLLSNGFKLRNNDWSYNYTDTYIYMAFAENPFITSGAVPVTAR